MENAILYSRRILNVSLILAWVANGVIGTFLALYVNELGGSLLEVSLVSAIPNIAALLTSAPWGGLSDRLNDRKLFIMIGNGSLGFTILAFVFLRTPIQLLSVYGFGSLFIAASVPTLSAYVTLSTRSSGRSLGNLLSVQSIGWAIGSLTGGFLYEAGSIQWALLLGAVASLVGTLIFRLRFREFSNSKGLSSKLSLKEYVRVQRMRGILPACLHCRAFAPYGE